MCASPVPMGLAPPFGDLSKRYPSENLAEALAEGIVTGHPAMPRFTFEPREIGAPIAWPAHSPTLSCRRATDSESAQRLYALLA